MVVNQGEGFESQIALCDDLRQGPVEKQKPISRQDRARQDQVTEATPGKDRADVDRSARDPLDSAGKLLTRLMSFCISESKTHD